MLVPTKEGDAVLTASFWQRRPDYGAPQVHIYTDGSGGSGKESTGAGWGLVSVRADSAIHTDFGSVATSQAEAGYDGAERGTNNTGELTAVLRALQWLKSDDGKLFKAAEIVYDSTYAADAARGRMRAKTNKALVRKARAALRALDGKCSVTWAWVKGHSGQKWNEKADELAGRGAKLASPAAQTTFREEVAKCDWAPKKGPVTGPPLSPVGHLGGGVRWVNYPPSESVRVLRATTLHGVLNIRPQREDIPRDIIKGFAAKVMSRLDKEPGAAAREAKNRVKAASIRLQKPGVQYIERVARSKLGPPVHAVDVDIDVENVRLMVSTAGDTSQSRTVRKHMGKLMRRAKLARPGVARVRIEYNHSDLGRDLIESGHVTGSRLYARGPDPFKWAHEYRDAALVGTWNCDDSSAFPRARLAMQKAQGGVGKPFWAERFIAHKDVILEGAASALYDSTVSAAEGKRRMKVITTAFDMGASLDFWKKDMGDGRKLETLRNVSVPIPGGTSFYVERYHAELTRSASSMAAANPSMMEYLSLPGGPSKGKKKLKVTRGRTNPALTLKSYILQEAESVSREAKIECIRSQSLGRVISLQHDGLGVTDVRDPSSLAVSLTRAASEAAGYVVGVKAERVELPLPPLPL